MDLNQEVAESRQEIAGGAIETEQADDQRPARPVHVSGPLSPDAPELLPDGGADSSAAIRDLLHRFANRTNDGDALQVGGLAEPNARVDNPNNAATTIPLEYRSSARRIAIAIEQQDVQTSFGVQIEGEGLGRWWKPDNRATLSPIDPSMRHISTPRPLRDIGPDSTVDDGGLDIPGLRIVARNDNPAVSKSSNLPSPDLQLIELDTKPTALQPSEDLLTRLSGSWEHSFVAADEDTSVNLRVKRSEDAAITRPNFPDHRPEASADAGDPNASQDSSPDLTMHLQTQEGARSAPEDPSNATPITLFNDFLPVVSRSTVVSSDATLPLRQAALEIASELRHLQDTGGTELSFVLRLHPEHLGPVDVSIQRVNDIWSISIVTAHDEATRALASEINRLEHRFRESSLTLDAISVVTKAPAEAVSGPAAADRPSASHFEGGGRQGLAGDTNRDQSGWRNRDPGRILGFDSLLKGEATQDLTSSHGTGNDTGIDIKA